MTADEQQALKDTAAAAAAAVGLTGVAKSDWTIEERKAYVDYFIAAVKQNPDMFSPQTVATAHAINTQNYYVDYAALGEIGIANTILDAAAAVGAPVTVANGLIDALNGIGQGASNLGKLLPVVLPVALILLVIFAAKSGAKKVESFATF